MFLTFILGGFGKYSGMGFGSFSTEDVDIDNIYRHIQVLNPNFSIKSKYGVSWLENRHYKPNMIKSILLGRPQSGILKNIEDARYVTKKANKLSLWLDSVESSIKVSVANQRKPIVIVFYNKNACKQLQENFCKYIL